ncbi:dihydroxy-acid dehydratase [Lichenicola cladoniae]|uniref:Dihydroxy-acid dehydratase n=1 Tax=Lichenicola cladoniae TaxID=1484109 RepID=A0A6M8HRJ7_9PROT|nr:L-arabinonate dehydratase [Lichenicola cladoniae]NPD69069.1 dihydroxy-acid dehydratase [Acetobacteraceae bacterium]QKE90895.1 dihydroxy-acid dehydratase [Lichenicola cladoniae]
MTTNTDRVQDRAARHPPRTPEDLRSHRWFGINDLRSFGHRSRMKQMGYAPEEFTGRPVIAIVNTWSGLAHCHAHFPQRVEDVKRGVLQAGGFPVEIPVMALPENFVKPTTMLYRNLLAMEVEENLRSQPIDGAVLMGGCDKTTPALLMGAASAGLPAIFMPAGPMLRGNWRGQVLGSGSDIWKYWDERRAGNITDADWEEMEAGIARSDGVCMTMGTAATMTALAEVLGMALPGSSSIPAPDANHPRMASACGRRAVELVWADIVPSDIMTPAAFDNAIRASAALAGSTNAIIHLIALARRCGVPLALDRFDELSAGVPVLADIRPSGRFLMEDFYYAGGLPALLTRLRDRLDLTQRNIDGRSLGEILDRATVWNDEVIRPLDKPVSTLDGLAVLRGNLAPDGCVMKPSAAEPRLLQHTGPAIVFDDYNQMAAAIDREDLDVTADHVMVLRNAGPQGGPGMPEWGMLPIPTKLVKAGVRDMVRLSDARMSGTSYGACILHIAPESFVGGPLALVQNGDMIQLDVPERRLTLLVAEDELARRRAVWTPPARHYPRGYGALFSAHTGQADSGCDLDFLQAAGQIAEPEIH